MIRYSREDLAAPLRSISERVVASLSCRQTKRKMMRKCVTSRASVLERAFDRDRTKRWRSLYRDKSHRVALRH